MEERRDAGTLIEMVREAEEAKLASDLEKNPMLHKGNDDSEPDTRITGVKSAKRCWIWDTQTFEKLPCLEYMLPGKLTQKREDGSYRFTHKNPHREPVMGNIKCMLHEDSPNREHTKQMGFRTCPMDNIRNQFGLIQHMRVKHKREWEAIEQERLENERTEDRKFQQLLIASQLAKTTPVSQAVSRGKRAKVKVK